MTEQSNPAVRGFEAIDLTAKKGVLIDLDNTLYPYKENHQRGLDACCLLAKDKFDLETAEFINSYMSGRAEVHEVLKFRAASHSRLLYFQRASESLYGTTDTRFSLEMENCYWEHFIDGMRLFSEAKHFLLTCREEKIRTCIVTDLTTQVQMQKWQKLSLDGLVDLMVTSEEAGIEKPDPVIFEMALSKLGMNKAEVIMIGDNHAKDVMGGEAIGIRSYLIEPM